VRRLVDSGALEILAFEKGEHTSYSACGIPFVVGGEVDELDDLVLRTPAAFSKQGIDVRIRTEVTAIDLDQRRVEVRDLAQDTTSWEGFDLLHIGTGATPLRPDLPGIDGENVFGVQTLGDAAELLRAAESGGAMRVVVVGGGYIGLEMAEAFVRRGAAVTVVEAATQVMSSLDPDVGALVSDAMRSHGIDVRCGTPVQGFERGAVLTDDGPIEADLIVLGLGVVPNSILAAEAGIETGLRKAIVVDDRQRTSAEGVWAAGDCCQSHHLVSGGPAYIPLGTHANRQARVAGLVMAGREARFPGVVGTAVTKVCSTEVARTGLSEKEAADLGLEFRAATIEATTRAGYYPGAGKITVKMLGERGSGRLLGAQLVGLEGAAKRVDVVATALHARMTVADLVDLDLGYAPPFSPLWDPVQVAARALLPEL
jgi:NADPH-dependent 2,4-dienoyl-CoA reductase/sulfur reductase-like enzyme